MTEKDILRAMSEIDASFILSADPALPRKRVNWKKWTAVAACFCLLAILAVGYYNVVLRGASAPGPTNLNYATLAEMNAAIGKETLYNNSTIEYAEDDLGRILVSYFEDEDGNIDHHDPNQLNISISDGSIRVDYYILFGRDDVDDSRIGGYEEQKLRREINGVTVHYSKIFDGSYHSQAKFIYDGDLYVIDVTSKEDIHDIQNYIDRILKEE